MAGFDWFFKNKHLLYQLQHEAVQGHVIVTP